MPLFSPLQPLAEASMSDLCVWVHVTARSSKVVRMVLPSVQLRDTRPGVQPERALALTTHHVVDVQQQVRSVRVPRAPRPWRPAHTSCRTHARVPRRTPRLWCLRDPVCMPLFVECVCASVCRVVCM